MSLLIYPFFCQAYYPIFKSQAMMFQAPYLSSMKDIRLVHVCNKQSFPYLIHWRRTGNVCATSLIITGYQEQVAGKS